VFALHYDVGYLAEPMVCYREHETSMTNKLMTENVMQCSDEDISMPWVFKDKVLEVGRPDLVLKCLDAAAYEFARRLTTKRYRQRQASMDSQEFETSLKSHAKNHSEERFVRARVEFYLADYHYWQGDISLARESYARSIRRLPWQPSAWIKWLLASTGSVGAGLRKRRAELLRPRW
jgi:hypothetical protein